MKGREVGYTLFSFLFALLFCDLDVYLPISFALPLYVLRREKKT